MSLTELNHTPRDPRSGRLSGTNAAKFGNDKGRLLALPSDCFCRT